MSVQRPRSSNGKFAETSATFLFKLCVLCAMLAVVTSDASSQAPTRAEASPAMKKLAAALVGEWRGTSWINMPTGRQSIESWEKVESRMDDLVLLIHGRHTSLEKADSGKVVFEAVAMVFHDPAQNRIRVMPVRMDGHTVETEAALIDSTFQWGFSLPNNAGRIRYTMDLGTPDTWIETGEFSRDGSTWVPTLGLSLKRVH